MGFYSFASGNSAVGLGRSGRRLWHRRNLHQCLGSEAAGTDGHTECGLFLISVRHLSVRTPLLCDESTMLSTMSRCENQVIVSSSAASGRALTIVGVTPEQHAPST